MNEFKFIIKGKYYSLYNNDIYYGSNTYTNNLYIPDLEMLRFNLNGKNNILNNQFPCYLWYCKIYHINT